MAYTSFAPLGSQFTTDTSGVFVPQPNYQGHVKLAQLLETPKAHDTHQVTIQEM